MLRPYSSRVTRSVAQSSSPINRPTGKEPEPGQQPLPPTARLGRDLHRYSYNISLKVIQETWNRL